MHGARADHPPVRKMVEWVRERFPEAGPPVASETCLYTTTGDHGFVLERHGRIVVECPEAAERCVGQHELAHLHPVVADAAIGRRQERAEAGLDVRAAEALAEQLELERERRDRDVAAAEAGEAAHAVDQRDSGQHILAARR